MAVVGDTVPIRVRFRRKDGTIVNLTGASSPKIRVQLPSGPTNDLTATILDGDGPGGILTANQQLTEAETWRARGYCTLSGKELRTLPVEFEVGRDLKDPPP